MTILIAGYRSRMNQKHYNAAWKWMRQNPDAYRLFCRFANEMAEVGKKFGARLISNRIRWECQLDKVGTFKWNNNHTTYVALRWCDEHPQYAHLVNFRHGNKELQEDLFHFCEEETAMLKNELTDWLDSLNDDDLPKGEVKIPTGTGHNGQKVYRTYADLRTYTHALRVECKYDNLSPLRIRAIGEELERLKEFLSTTDQPSEEFGMFAV